MHYITKVVSDRNRDEQITFRLPKSLKDRLVEALEKTNRQQTNFMEMALKYYLDQLEKNNYLDPELLGVSEPESIYATKATKEEVRAINQEVAELKELVQGLIKKVEAKYGKED